MNWISFSKEILFEITFFVLIERVNIEIAQNIDANICSIEVKAIAKIVAIIVMMPMLVSDMFLLSNTTVCIIIYFGSIYSVIFHNKTA